MNLYFEHEELSAATAARELGVSRTAAFRMLYTLEAKGCLTRTAEGAYRLGIKLFSLGALAQSRMVLTGLVRPHLTHLADETGETAHLAIMDGPYHIVFVDKALGRLNLKMDTVLGDRRWAHQTATGKMLLSLKSREQWEQYARAAVFNRPTPNAITEPEALFAELELTPRARLGHRQRGERGGPDLLRRAAHRPLRGGHRRDKLLGTEHAHGAQPRCPPCRAVPRRRRHSKEHRVK